VNFPVPAGPPLHTIPPGVFDQTGGDRIGNGAQFGLCLESLGKRRPSRARIGGVVKCFLEVFWGGGFRTENGDFSFLWDRVKFLFFSRKIFPAKYFQNFFRKIRLKVFRKNFLIATHFLAGAVGSIFFTGVCPDFLWEEFRDISGREAGEFFKYFSGKENGFAIWIEELDEFAEPLNLYAIFERFVAPQSFCYIESMPLNDYVCTVAER